MKIETIYKELNKRYNQIDLKCDEAYDKMRYSINDEYAEFSRQYNYYNAERQACYDAMQAIESTVGKHKDYKLVK